MNRRRVLNFVVTSLGLILTVRHSAAQSVNNEIVGTWTLVSADGFGASLKGSLMFDRDGRFSAIFLRADLPKYASSKRSQGTADEYRATVNGSVAVFGTYTVSGSDLDLRIEGSTFPNWTGTDQKRCNVAISTTELSYIQPAPSAGGPPAVILWRRASPEGRALAAQSSGP